MEEKTIGDKIILAAVMRAIIEGKEIRLISDEGELVIKFIANHGGKS